MCSRQERHINHWLGMESASSVDREYVLRGRLRCPSGQSAVMWVWDTGGRLITLVWRYNECPPDVSAVIPMMVYLDQITSSHERGSTVDAMVLQSLLWWGYIEYPIAPCTQTVYAPSSGSSGTAATTCGPPPRRSTEQPQAVSAGVSSVHGIPSTTSPNPLDLQ